MKKIMMTLAAVLCCAMNLTVLSSCTSDDDDKTQEQPENTPAYAEVTFTFWGTQDLLDIADITVTYNDGTDNKTETVTSADWVKTVKAALPVSFKFERKVTLKEGVTLKDDQTYSYINKHQTKYLVTTAKGMTLKGGTAGALTKEVTSLKGSEINAVITSGLMDVSYTYNFDKDGKCPQLDFPDDNITDDSQQPATTGTYTMTIVASKGGDKTLNATWATSEHVYVQKGSTWATGYLQPQTDGATTALKGELSGITISANDELTLQSPRSGDRDYTGQVGTLADIAAKYDYATATVKVASISSAGNINPVAATTTFTNQQAIVKFTLIDKADGTTLSPNALTITVNFSSSVDELLALQARVVAEDKGMTFPDVTSLTIPDATYTENGSGIIYLAIPDILATVPAIKNCFDFTLTATVGSKIYTVTKTGFPFSNGKYYDLTEKMAKYVAEGHALSASAVGEIVGSDGKAYAVADKGNMPDGVNAVAMVAYKNGTNGLAIQLNGELKYWNWTQAMNYTGYPAVPGGTWRLPSKDDWENMFAGCKVDGDATTITYTGELSGTMDPIVGFMSKIEATGATWIPAFCWSSTGNGSSAWAVLAYPSKASFNFLENSSTGCAIGCLAF